MAGPPLMAELAAALSRRRAMETGEIWADPIPVDGLPRAVALFLGSGRDASNLEKLRENRVGRVLNVADDVPNFHRESGDGVTYRRLEVADFGAESRRANSGSGGGGIRRVFDEAMEFVLGEPPDDGTSLGPSILVHCANGSNRSVTVVIALLMMIDGVDLRTAWTEVKSKRRCAMPLRDNRTALVEFEEGMRGIGSMRESDFKA